MIYLTFGLEAIRSPMPNVLYCTVLLDLHQSYQVCLSTYLLYDDERRF